jgi:uncharacterized protein
MKFERDPDLVRWLELLTITKDSFQWDCGNSTKNAKHGVRREEVEEVFQNEFVLAGKILEPYHPENRWILFGETLKGRRLALIFTVRDGLIRPISCRPVRKEEGKIYEEISKRHPGR